MESFDKLKQVERILVVVKTFAAFPRGSSSNKQGEAISDPPFHLSPTEACQTDKRMSLRRFGYIACAKVFPVDEACCDDIRRL